MRCVFLVRFDVSQGNVVEWSHPPASSAELEGLEFKALPGGIHAVRCDIVFLRQAGNVGVACFDNMATADATQRNARMCSVGCLADDPSELYAACNELAAEAKRQNEDAEAGRADYTRMTQIYHAHGAQAVAPVPSLLACPPASPSSFSSMLQFFGPDIFVLWKAALLRKRILFFSPVPIEQGCSRVRWMGEMVGTQGDTALVASLEMMYYVNVFDIDQLTTMQSYIACTSEQIFAEKRQLYDVYVNGRTIEFSTPELGKQLRCTAVDHSRFGLLDDMNDRSQDAIASYFKRHNSEMLGKIEALCSISRGDARTAGGEGGVALTGTFLYCLYVGALVFQVDANSGPVFVCQSRAYLCHGLGLAFFSGSAQAPATGSNVASCRRD